MQIRAEKARATFFERAGLALEGQHSMEISSTATGQYNVPL
jgi:hypothetical protein